MFKFFSVKLRIKELFRFSWYSLLHWTWKRVNGYNNSVIAISFCAWVRSCIFHAFYLIFTHDNVINLAVYATYFVGVGVNNWVWSCCYVALFVLEGSVAQKFVVFVSLNKFLSIIIPVTAGLFSCTGFKIICFSNFSIKVSRY